MILPLLQVAKCRQDLFEDHQEHEGDEENQCGGEDPFLAVTGVRMLAVDLSSGHTLVLVMALTAYGTALIVSTWLLRGARTQMPPQ